MNKIRNSDHDNQRYKMYGYLDHGVTVTEVVQSAQIKKWFLALIKLITSQKHCCVK